MVIRPAMPEDTLAIGHVHVESWRSTYRGLLPDSVLEGLSLEQRAASWRQAAESALANGGRSFVLVAEDSTEGIIGFAAAGPEREENAGYDCELYAIYLLERHQGRRVGYGLVRQSVDRLLAQGHESMRVWVLEDNPAEGFYQRLGGQPAGRKVRTSADRTYAEIAYAWPDLARFPEDA